MIITQTSSYVAALFLFLATTVRCADKVLRNSYLDGQEIIDFLVKGHIIVRNVLPELGEQAFLDELEDAKIETGRVYHEFALEKLGCKNDLPVFWYLLNRLKEGDGLGSEILDKCIQHVRSKKETEKPRNHHDIDEPPDEDERIPFYQLIDLHHYSLRIYNIATSSKFASMASDLLQASRVRLYQTGTFRKDPPKDDDQYDSEAAKKYNGGTSWHTDLHNVPVDTNDYLTFWCPTRNVTSEDSILLYGPGSHNDMSRQVWYDNGYTSRKYSEEYEEDLSREEYQRARKTFHTTCRKSRDFEEAYDLSSVKRYKKKKMQQCPKRNLRASFEKASQEYEKVRKQAREEYREKKWNSMEGHINRQHQRLLKKSKRYGVDSYEEINVGDCVIHHGWLKHGATSQTVKNGPREAITFSYINGDDKKLGSAKSRQGKPFFTKDGTAEDEMSFRQWYYDVEEEGVIDHPKLILVWPPAEEFQEGGDIELQTKQNETENNACTTCEASGTLH